MLKTMLLLCILLATVSMGSLQADAIHDAASKGDVVKIKALLKNRPNLVNSVDKDGATALHFAVAKGHIEVVKILIENKANVNAAKNDGVTPLHVAAALGKKEIAEILLTNKAEVNSKDKKGRTPLDVAQSNNQKDIVSLLEARGAVNGGNGECQPNKPITISASGSEANCATFDPESAARELVRQITSGDFAGVVSKFDANMSNLLPKEKLESTYNAIIAQVGSFRCVNSVRISKIRGCDVADVICSFEKTTLNFQVSFNSARQVNGLYMLPSK